MFIGCAGEYQRQRMMGAGTPEQGKPHIVSGIGGGSPASADWCLAL